MAMDPMTMAQGMYGGFTGQEFSGMNGMNGGMGFSNGQGAYGGYNGQPGAWNAGQDAFNQNAYGAMSSGFGAQSGYSEYSMSPQGNFNNVHQQHYPNNDYNSGHNGYGFQGRGRGRGRGYYNAGRGRGGYNQSHTGYNTKYQQYQEQMHNQYPHPFASINGDKAQDETTTEAQSEKHSNIEASQPMDAQRANEKDLRDIDVGSEEIAQLTEKRPAPNLIATRLWRRQRRSHRKTGIMSRNRNNRIHKGAPIKILLMILKPRNMYRSVHLPMAMAPRNHLPCHLRHLL